MIVDEMERRAQPIQLRAELGGDRRASAGAEATIAGAKHRVLGEQIGQCVDRAVIDRIGIARDEIAQHERSEENTYELQSLMRISYAAFCLKKKTHDKKQHH